MELDLGDKLQTGSLRGTYQATAWERAGRRNKKAFLDRNEMLNERASSRLDLIAILIAKKKANTHPALSLGDDQLVFLLFSRFH